jgi:F-type H+-transporting ATPase subunit alpha
LPIAETQAGHISAYIPTNLISITDGQIYLDPRLFYEDQKPAADVGKSVSRVSGKTQAPVLQTLSESLRLEYAQFLELEVFTRFGTMVDQRTRKVIEHGRRIRAVLRQPQFEPLTLGEQVALLVAVSEGVLDEVPLDKVDAFRASLGTWLAEHCSEALSLDDQAAVLSEDLRGRLAKALEALAHSVAVPTTGDRK